MIALLLRAGKVNILAATAALVIVISYIDWLVGSTVSLAALYILPMMLGAVVMRPVEIGAMALLCSYLRACFDPTGSPSDLTLRFILAFVAYLVSGLFVLGWVRNGEAEGQLKIMAESSPAAILTIGGDGIVLAANEAANRLFLTPSGETMKGQKIRDYLPVLGDALRAVTPAAGLRTTAQSQGVRQNGEVFLAHMWFSLHETPRGRQLAAIVVDSSEEMRAREEQGLRQLLTGNRIMATALSHEVRNFCGALGRLCESLNREYDLAANKDFLAVLNVIGGLETMALLKLDAKSQAVLETVLLKDVLDNLRIVIDADWREIGGEVRWSLPNVLPRVWAESHGLLQAFLNLAKNSHRAVQREGDRVLAVSVVQEGKKVMVRFEDSGPGVARPEALFQPFQTGALGNGLGLYVSRSIVRSYGGDLRFEPKPRGCTFAVELEAVA